MIRKIMFLLWLQFTTQIAPCENKKQNNVKSPIDSTKKKKNLIGKEKTNIIWSKRERSSDKYRLDKREKKRSGMRERER